MVLEILYFKMVIFKIKKKKKPCSSFDHLGPNFSINHTEENKIVCKIKARKNLQNLYSVFYKQIFLNNRKKSIENEDDKPHKYFSPYCPVLHIMNFGNLNNTLNS